MNHKHIIVMLSIILTTYRATSQTQTSTSLLTGYSDNGLAALANFQLYLGQTFKNYYEIGLYTGFLKETKSEFEIPLNVYTLNTGYHLRVDKISSRTNTIVTTLGIGGVIGVERLNKGNNTLTNGALIESNDGLIYGAYGALETNIYLSDRWSLIGRYTHFYHANSEVGQSKFMVGAGIKYLFI